MEEVLDLMTKEEEQQDNSKQKFVSPAYREESLDNIDLESRLTIEVTGPRWHQDNIIYQGHYEFCVQSYRSGPCKLNFLSDRTITEVERRYSDFDLLRQALSCEYPGFFIPMLPPKETFLAFKHEDSDSLLQRKLGIKQFLYELGTHPQLSREENTTFNSFLSLRSSH